MQSGAKRIGDWNKHCGPDLWCCNWRDGIPILTLAVSWLPTATDWIHGVADNACRSRARFLGVGTTLSFRSSRLSVLAQAADFKIVSVGVNGTDPKTGLRAKLGEFSSY